MLQKLEVLQPPPISPPLVKQAFQTNGAASANLVILESWMYTGGVRAMGLPRADARAALMEELRTKIMGMERGATGITRLQELLARAIASLQSSSCDLP